MPWTQLPTDPNLCATTVGTCALQESNTPAVKNRKSKAEGIQNSSRKENGGASNSIPNNNYSNEINKNM